MRTQVMNQAAFRSIAMGYSEPAAEQPLLSRWCAAEGKFIIAELDWDDPLDAAIAQEVVRFRAGFDPFDA